MQDLHLAFFSCSSSLSQLFLWLFWYLYSTPSLAIGNLTRPLLCIGRLIFLLDYSVDRYGMLILSFGFSFSFITCRPSVARALFGYGYTCEMGLPRRRLVDRWRHGASWSLSGRLVPYQCTCQCLRARATMLRWHQVTGRKRRAGGYS